MLTTISGQRLSKFCFGTMQFGQGSDRKQSKAIYAQCRHAGINHFDTAHAYTKGLSETWLGEFSRNERDNVFISLESCSDGYWCKRLCFNVRVFIYFVSRILL